MQFRVIVVTDPPTNPQTDRQDRLQYTVPQLACSVMTKVAVNIETDTKAAVVQVMQHS